MRKFKQPNLVIALVALVIIGLVLLALAAIVSAVVRNAPTWMGVLIIIVVIAFLVKE
jgi:uncharacterized protein (DUF983 family)